MKMGAQKRMRFGRQRLSKPYPLQVKLAESGPPGRESIKKLKRVMTKSREGARNSAPRNDVCLP